MQFCGSTILARATRGSAGYDLVSDESVMIPPDGKGVLVSTGLRIGLEPSSVGIIKSRSGLASQHHIEVGAGVIDSDYRGEVKVLLRNFGDEPFRVTAGMRIAQMVILPILTPEPIMVSTETFNALATDRGLGGFGSTGLVG